MAGLRSSTRAGSPGRLGWWARVNLSQGGRWLQGLGTTRCHVHPFSGAGEVQTDQKGFHLGQEASLGWSTQGLPGCVWANHPRVSIWPCGLVPDGVGGRSQ